jgi:LysM repeat protein
MKLLVLALLLGASARAAGTPETYSVRTGDTASSIAAAHYGDPRLGSLLLAYNERPASAVRQGEKLAIPRCRTHRAAKGETWSSLADSWLGRSSFGSILAELNGASAERALRPGERLVIPIVLEHKLASKDSLSSLAARFYGDPRKARILQGFNRVPSGKAPAPGTVIGIPLTSFVGEPTAAVPSPPPVAAAPAPPVPQFAAPLRAAEMDFVYGDYERARVALEELRGPVASTGSAADRRDLSRLLAFTYVALDRSTDACAAYAAAPPPRIELDPDLVSPKIRQVLETCGLDSPRPDPQIPSHGDEGAGREL